MESSDAMRLGSCVAIALGILGAAATGRADEPRKVTEPRVLKEPAEVTQVVDAFDDDDPFDLHLTLGYQHTWKSANILRESFINQPGLATGGFTASTMNVAKYTETTSRLNTRADIGVFKDIALVVRVPIILSNDRKLEGLDGSDDVQPVVLQGAPGEQLFSLPFKSPTRSGVEYLAVGVDLGIMNQFRDRTKPTWIVGLEGRFSVSEPMHPCTESTNGLNQAGPQKKCAHPSDINRNGRDGEFIDNGRSLEGSFKGGQKPGVSRGVTGLELHTMLSKRIKYIEPYGGFRALFEFQNENSEYGQTDFEGSLVNHPPLEGSMILGMYVIPWEVRDAFQRVSIDFRFTGTYRSEGRDYSELFDALGSSDALSLRHPNFASYRGIDPPVNNNYSEVDPNSQRVYFSGLTDVQQHGIYKFSTEFTWQAGEYVKFALGGGYTIVQSHLISFDQPCNPDIDNKRLATAGPCKSTAGDQVRATGKPNPNYRPTINIPGRRFLVDDSHAFDAWINATVMF
jgi:hypothetical protein